MDFIKQHFNIPIGQNDEYIQKLLRMAISQAETSTDRSILYKKWRYTNKQTKIFLPKPPIVKIISVEVMGSKGDFVSTKKYSQSMHSGYSTIVLDKKYPENTKVQIVYEAGFTKETLPPSILQYVMHRFEVLYTGVVPDPKTYDMYQRLLDPYKTMRSKI